MKRAAWRICSRMASGVVGLVPWWGGVPCSSARRSSSASLKSVVLVEFPRQGLHPVFTPERMGDLLAGRGKT